MAGEPMLLRHMQAELAALYGTPVSYDVQDFLITDPAVAAALAPHAAHSNRERVLVAESEDDLRLSLYIDATVLERLEADDPRAALHPGNLEAFLIALEGISHLHYLMWRAGQDQPVSLLELELQAEVDKYVTAASLLAEQRGGRIPPHLHHELFEAVTYDENLAPDARQRYREANYYAARYCHALRSRFPGHHRQPSFVRELRGFYRLRQNQKIRHIRTAS